MEGETDEKVVALALDCCRAGAELTASLWYSARIGPENIHLPEWHGLVEVGSRMDAPGRIVVSGQQE